MIIINIAEDFTRIPWCGKKTPECNESGEGFLEMLLYPRFIEAMNTKQKLLVNLDGAYGYSSAFLEEAFGGLLWNLKKDGYNPKIAYKILVIKSKDYDFYGEIVYKCMKEELKKIKKEKL